MQVRRKRPFLGYSPLLLVHLQVDNMNAANRLWKKELAEAVLLVSHRPGTKGSSSPNQKKPLRVLDSDPVPTQKADTFLSSSCTQDSLPHSPGISFISHTMLLQPKSTCTHSRSYSEVPPPTLSTRHDLKKQLGMSIKRHHLPVPCISWNSSTSLGQVRRGVQQYNHFTSKEMRLKEGKVIPS